MSGYPTGSKCLIFKILHTQQSSWQPLLGSSRNASPPLEKCCVTTLITAAKETTNPVVWNYSRMGYHLNKGNERLQLISTFNTLMQKLQTSKLVSCMTQIKKKLKKRMLRVIIQEKQPLEARSVDLLQCHNNPRDADVIPVAFWSTCPPQPYLSAQTPLSASTLRRHKSRDLAPSGFFSCITTRSMRFFKIF